MDGEGEEGRGWGKGGEKKTGEGREEKRGGKGGERRERREGRVRKRGRRSVGEGRKGIR